MRRTLLIVAVVTALSIPLLSHDIITTKLTYTRDVRPILTQRCIACHGEGSSIPLTNYEQVRPWAVSLKEQVLERKMPPWGVVKGYGPLRDDEALSQQEVLILSAWAVGGAPKGDDRYLAKTQAVTLTPGSGQSRGHSAIAGHTVIATLGKPIASALRVSALQPVATTPIASQKVIAKLPDGSRLPLLWLYRYDPALSRTFVLTQPVELPGGTVLQTPPSTLKDAQSDRTESVKQVVLTIAAR